MNMMASQITSLTIVYSPHKGPVTRKMFHEFENHLFDEVGAIIV